MYDGPDLRAGDRPNRISAPRQGSMSAAVLDAAEEFFTRTGGRAMAPEITAELYRVGVVPSADVGMTRTVASYLSTAKGRFNNVRGQGYGLASWPRTERDEAESPEAEEHAEELSAPMPNCQTMALEEMLS